MLIGEYYNSLKTQIESEKNVEDKENNLQVIDDCSYPRLIEDEGYEMYDFLHIPFFYISDIHIVHRIFNKFKDNASEDEIRLYIKDLVEKMVNSVGTMPFNSYLLIGGDTSSNFEIAKIFYGELIKLWNPKNIVVVSGNHELWDPYVELEDNINEYRAYFKKSGITYLQNDLLYIGDMGSSGVIKEEELAEKSVEEIRKIVSNCSVIIFGGIGFSGLNDKYNAINIRYGKSFEDVSPDEARKKDINESARINYLYDKLLAAVPKNKVIVLTHMQKDDWNDEEYNPNWIYLNGHTHHNFYEVNDKRAIYADNQIGYGKKKVILKHFYIDDEYDVYAYEQDGIHELSIEDYNNFNRGKRLSISFKRQDDTIYMLKKNDNYMFFIYCCYSKQSEDKHLYFLSGGKLCKLARDRVEDLQYYYDYLDKYAENIQQFLFKYTDYQKRISEFIKKIGGSGKIHGSIIDVERADGEQSFSYCHVFVNPIDGKVTPYFAQDVTSRTVYKDLKTMLESERNCKLLKDNYSKLEEKLESNLPAIKYSSEVKEWGDEKSKVDKGGYLYQVSRIIKSLQYCTEHNVIRIWNEKLLNDV